MRRRNTLITALASAAILAGSLAGATAAVAGTPTVPSVPTVLTATPGNTTVTLNWVAPSNDGGTAILGYNVYESTSAGGENYSWPGNGNILILGTNAVVRGLTNGTTYYFTVSAVNGAGVSVPSNESWAVPGGTVPGAPTSVVASQGDASVTVTWNQPTNQGGSAITSYKVTAADATQSSRGGQTCSWTTGPLSCVVTGLTNGDSYTFTVTATNSVGTSQASSPSSPVVPTAASGKKVPTRTTLALSSGGVRYGHEGLERISAIVTPTSGPAPTGRVFVMAEECLVGPHHSVGYCPFWSLEPRMQFACVIRLASSGSGSCTLANRAFGAGTYRLWAFYTGSKTDMHSASTSKVFVVFKNYVSHVSH